MSKENQYTIHKQLGSGVFGIVYLAFDQKGQKWAIKRLPKISENLSREVQILLALQN